MGIPHLTTTLQPYADHRALQDEAVVIDGPALAYHILHICRVNGVAQPSYRLVGDSTIAWLDDLANHRVVVEAIYFDGQLPESKLAVRMEWMMRNTAQVARLFSHHPQGCPKNHVLAGRANNGINVFKAGVPETKPSVDPAFFVPAVIEALRLHPKYKDLSTLVPGEADAFCASHVSKRGGIVLTSDSDLLVHDLGSGEVAFFRDIHRDVDSRIVCACFAPRRICERLGLALDTGLCRLAYEQKCSPHAVLSQMIQTCSRPPSSPSDFLLFCKEYQQQGDDLSPSSGLVPFSILEAFDPRLSEVVVQLQWLSSTRGTQEADPKMFLPTLIENCDRGTAWEPSTFIRQLAYSLLGMSPSQIENPVMEYRRVQSTTQRGKRVELMSSTEAEQRIDEILLAVESTKSLTRSRPELHWPLVALTLDVSGCQSQGKQSHVWRILQQDNSRSRACTSKVDWQLVHFFAHLQASMYSLRMLHQTRSTFHTNEATQPPNIGRLWRVLANFPALADFPDLPLALNLLLFSSEQGLLRPLSQLLEIPAPTAQKAAQGKKRSKVGRKKDGTERKRHGEALQQTRNIVRVQRNNIFDLLPID